MLAHQLVYSESLYYQVCLSSRLYKNIKEQNNLAFSISASNGSFRDDGTVYIKANFVPKNQEKLEKAIFEEISNIQKYGISEDELNRAKNEGIDIGVTIGKDICDILSEETEIPLDVVTETCDGVLISNVRQMLQFIGTDLIRKYNTDWHVNRIRAMIDENKNYVIDDVRFPNEKKMIEDLGGDCWFVTRTTLDNISNHESETSLTWKDCWNKVIINDTTLSNLQFKWETFISNYERSRAIRDKEFNRILENGSQDEITPLSIYDMMLLHKASCFMS